MKASDESLEIRRKRLLFRSWRRGSREMDLILGRFADRNLPTFSERQIELYEALLECSDPDLYAWISGAEPPPAAADNDVLRLLMKIK